MNVELPKDAKGREIPLNVDALYSKDGIRMPVFGWKYTRSRNHNWMVQFLFDDSDCIYYPEDYYLTPPDSWEKLEDDLDSCSASSRYVACAYFNKSSNDCEECLADPNKECITQMTKHIALRVHNLRCESK